MTKEAATLTDVGLSEALKTVFDWGARATEIIETGESRLLVHPDRWQVSDLTQKLELAEAGPRRARGVQKAQSLGTFIQLTQELEAGTNAGSKRTYADRDTQTFRTVFNDHTADVAGWRDYAVEYRPQLSPEAKAWLGKDRTQFDQIEFAEFVEDHIADLADGALLLTIATTLQAKTEVQFASSKRLDNGQTQLIYNEVIGASAGGGAIEIPREFALGIPLFERTAPYLIKCRLKYRLGASKVRFWYEIDRRERLMQDAIDQMAESIKEAGITVYDGA